MLKWVRDRQVSGAPPRSDTTPPNRSATSDREFYVDRARAVRSAIAAVRNDEGLTNLARAGDGARDARDWRQALRFYDELLAQTPLHSGYVVQRAHMMKELEEYLAAEISYRDAIALGAPPADVLEHLAFVTQRNGFFDEPYPDTTMRMLETIARTPTGRHSAEELRFVTSGDVSALAELLVGQEQFGQSRVLAMMRHHPKLDDCVAAFIGDESFGVANPALLRTLLTAGVPA